MTGVKICGISHPAHAVIAAEAGADFIGLHLAPSRRQVTPERAKAIVDAVRSSSDNPPKLVGVFVDADSAEMNRLAEEVGFDMAQLSGDEDPDTIAEIERPVIKALHVPAGPPSVVAWAGIRRGLAIVREAEALPLLDTKVEGHAGGTGRSFDWEVARQLAEEFEFMLAGGLTPENVAKAVAYVLPWAVDVSSGVETDGVKDPAKIRAFIAVVRASDAG